MVFESILNPLAAEKKPAELFFLGIVYAIMGVGLAYVVFPAEASLLMVFFAVMAAIPLIYNTIRFEEKKDLAISSLRRLLFEHHKALIFYLLLFCGVTVGFTICYVAVPLDTISTLFSTQQTVITNINNQISGQVVSVDLNHVFYKILFNNMQVLGYAIGFAFLYGTGALFILFWNASIIATAMGNFIRSKLAAVGASFGLVEIAQYFDIVSLGILRYAIHGIPEILAYLYGGLAGGIISVAIIQKHYKTPHFRRIIDDVSSLLLLAVGFLVLAAFLEVFVTPKVIV